VKMEQIHFFGNMYGFHDGYDGSVFGDDGVSPGIRAGATHIPYIVVSEVERDPNKVSDI